MPGYSFGGVHFPQQPTLIKEHGGSVFWNTAIRHQALNSLELEENSPFPE